MSSWRLVRTTAIAFCIAAPLAGCGKLGELEQPGPLSAARSNGDPSHRIDTVDPRDRTTDPAPPRAEPIPGTSGSSNAAGPPPPTAQPDVHSSPR